MKRTSGFSAAFLLVVVSLLGTSSTLAQDAPPQDAAPQEDAPSTQSLPKPAGRGYQPFGDDLGTDSTDGTVLVPDNSPLTGAFVPGMGSQEMRHSYWVPGLQYGNFVRSSTDLAPSVTNWNTTSYVAGNVSVLEQWSWSQLTLNYTGGGTFSTDQSQGNSYFHQLEMIQAFTWRRWQLSLMDQFSYLPQAQFGFGSSSGLALPGVAGSLAPSLPGLQTSYQPSQSIFAAVGSRYSNATTGQLDYEVSPRGSLTWTASYGLLRFVQQGVIDSNDAIFGMGYNYALTKSDTIGIVYRYSTYEYLDNPQAIHDHVSELAYSKKITGRLALQLFAGPEFVMFRVHPPGVTDRTTVAGGATVKHALPTTTLSVSYNHGVSGGSGVFSGANTDSVTGSITRQLSRVWHGNVSFGYARNSSLTSVLAPLAPIYHSYFAGAGIDRPLGRTANVSTSYTAEIQDAAEAGCTSLICNSYVQHQISVSLQWHARPFILR